MPLHRDPKAGDAKPDPAPGLGAPKSSGRQLWSRATKAAISSLRAGRDPQTGEYKSGSGGASAGGGRIDPLLATASTDAGKDKAKDGPSAKQPFRRGAAGGGAGGGPKHLSTFAAVAGALMHQTPGEVGTLLDPSLLDLDTFKSAEFSERAYVDQLMRKALAPDRVATAKAAEEALRSQGAEGDAKLRALAHGVMSKDGGGAGGLGRTSSEGSGAVNLAQQSKSASEVNEHALQDFEARRQMPHHIAEDTVDACWEALESLAALRETAERNAHDSEEHCRAVERESRAKLSRIRGKIDVATEQLQEAEDELSGAAALTTGVERRLAMASAKVQRGRALEALLGHFEAFVKTPSATLELALDFAADDRKAQALAVLRGWRRTYGIEDSRAANTAAIVGKGYLDDPADVDLTSVKRDLEMKNNTPGDHTGAGGSANAAGGDAAGGRGSSGSRFTRASSRGRDDESKGQSSNTGGENPSAPAAASAQTPAAAAAAGAGGGAGTDRRRARRARKIDRAGGAAPAAGTTGAAAGRGKKSDGGESQQRGQSADSSLKPPPAVAAEPDHNRAAESGKYATRSGSRFRRGQHARTQSAPAHSDGGDLEAGGGGGDQRSASNERDTGRGGAPDPSGGAGGDDENEMRRAHTDVDMGGGKKAQDGGSDAHPRSTSPSASAVVRRSEKDRPVVSKKLVDEFFSRRKTVTAVTWLQQLLPLSTELQERVENVANVSHFRNWLSRQVVSDLEILIKAFCELHDGQAPQTAGGEEGLRRLHGPLARQILASLQFTARLHSRLVSSADALASFFHKAAITNLQADILKFYPAPRPPEVGNSAVLSETENDIDDFFVFLRRRAQREHFLVRAIFTGDTRLIKQRLLTSIVSVILKQYIERAMDVAEQQCKAVPDLGPETASAMPPPLQRANEQTHIAAHEYRWSLFMLLLKHCVCFVSDLETLIGGHSATAAAVADATGLDVMPPRTGHGHSRELSTGYAGAASSARGRAVSPGRNPHAASASPGRDQKRLMSPAARGGLKSTTADAQTPGSRNLEKWGTMHPEEMLTRTPLYLVSALDAVLGSRQEEYTEKNSEISLLRRTCALNEAEETGAGVNYALVFGHDAKAHGGDALEGSLNPSGGTTGGSTGTGGLLSGLTTAAKSPRAAALSELQQELGGGSFGLRRPAAGQPGGPPGGLHGKGKGAKKEMDSGFVDADPFSFGHMERHSIFRSQVLEAAQRSIDRASAVAPPISRTNVIIQIALFVLRHLGVFVAQELQYAVEALTTDAPDWNRRPRGVSSMAEYFEGWTRHRDEAHHRATRVVLWAQSTVGKVLRFFDSNVEPLYVAEPHLRLSMQDEQHRVFACIDMFAEQAITLVANAIVVKTLSIVLFVQQRSDFHAKNNDAMIAPAASPACDIACRYLTVQLDECRGLLTACSGATDDLDEQGGSSATRRRSSVGATSSAAENATRRMSAMGAAAGDTRPPAHRRGRGHQRTSSGAETGLASMRNSHGRTGAASPSAALPGQGGSGASGASGGSVTATEIAAMATQLYMNPGAPVVGLGPLSFPCAIACGLHRGLVAHFKGFILSDAGALVFKRDIGTYREALEPLVAVGGVEGQVLSALFDTLKEVGNLMLVPLDKIAAIKNSGFLRLLPNEEKMQFLRMRSDIRDALRRMQE